MLTLHGTNPQFCIKHCEMRYYMPFPINFKKKPNKLQRWKLKHWSNNAISYLTVHNITSDAHWQKQLRWRRRPGNSHGYPGLPTAITKQTPHGLPLTWRWLLLPPSSHALTLSGKETPQMPSPSLPCSFPSHPIPREGNPGEWAAQEPQQDSHLRKQRSRPVKRYCGAHPPYSPK